MKLDFVALEFRIWVIVRIFLIFCIFFFNSIGTSNFVNKKRAVTIVESVEQENERQKLLYKLF